MGTQNAQWMSDAVRDLKHTVRGMGREAGFTTFVVLIIGLGIGASSTIFSVVNALLIRPLPFSDPARLVWIANQEWSTQVGFYLDLRERNTSFSDLAGYAGYGVGDTALTGVGEPERLTSVPITQNFFAVLGVRPLLGRSFTAEECRGRFNTPPAALLTHGFWERRFASDDTVVGRTLTLNNKPVVVVGVLPASFDFASVFAPGIQIDVFIPWPLTEETNRYGNTLKLFGRLRPGVTTQSAQAEFTLLAQQIGRQHPEWNGMRPRLSPLKEHVSGGLSPALIVLACAVGLVMLIVCANLSNLQLARMAMRQKEMALRTALGAGRVRLLRQMLTESVALSCCGAALGLTLAVAGTRALAHLDVFNLPLLQSVRIDGATLAFTLAAAVMTGVLFGLLPALQVPASGVAVVLNDATRGSSSGRRHAWIRNCLVVSEIAFACALLIAAGLLIRSFSRVLDIDPGFQSQGVATLRIDPSIRPAGLPRQNSYIDDVLQRTRALPGIRAAGLTDVLPLGGDRAWQVGARGQVYPKDQHPEAFVRVVSDGYFESVGIRVQTGRVFAESDRASSEPVVVINETLARTLWPGQRAVGQVMTQDGGRRVVGVVADVRHESLETAGGSEMYLPMRQTGDYSAIELVVRTELPPERLEAAMLGALRPVDPNLPVHELKTLQALVNKNVSPRRFMVLMLAGFACFALVLASLGTYAVISHSVNQRVQEIGIRMALGASPTNLQNHILLHTIGLAGLGVALGVAASRALTGALGNLLFGVTPGDPATFIGVGGLLIVVAAFAGYVPARRASRVDPMVALRAS
jgi:putative ABC transport system permease protein